MDVYPLSSATIPGCCRRRRFGPSCPATRTTRTTHGRSGRRHRCRIGRLPEERGAAGGPGATGSQLVKAPRACGLTYGEVMPHAIMTDALERVSERLPALGHASPVGRVAARGGRRDPDRGMPMPTAGGSRIPGVGVLTATAWRRWAIKFAPGSASEGGSACSASARQASDLLIHGARSALTHAKAPPEWAVRLAERRPATWSRSRWPTRRHARSLAGP